MLYVNSVQLRIELTHAYPIEILSQTRRYSRKLQKTESYIISNELYMFSIVTTTVTVHQLFFILLYKRTNEYIGAFDEYMK